MPDARAGAVCAVARARASTSSTPRGLAASDLERGIRWGSLMLSAMAALASLAAGLWFTRFVTVALERQDWVGWLAFALMALVALTRPHPAAEGTVGLPAPGAACAPAQNGARSAPG